MVALDAGILAGNQVVMQRTARRQEQGICFAESGNASRRTGRGRSFTGNLGCKQSSRKFSGVGVWRRSSAHPINSFAFIILRLAQVESEKGDRKAVGLMQRLSDQVAATLTKEPIAGVDLLVRREAVSLRA